MITSPPIQHEAPLGGLVARAVGNSKTVSLWVEHHELIASLNESQARRVAQSLLSNSDIVQIVGCVSAFTAPSLR